MAAIQGKIAAQLAATGSVPLPAGPIQGGGSGLIWPVNGPVVSGFGPRTINGSYEYHPGIDIAVPEGTPIRAAAAGTVIFTEPEASSGGYGNYTCIDHGGGLSTCYAHQELLRGLGRPAGLPGPGHRLQRLHRLLLRPARAFRGADQRCGYRSHGLPLGGAPKCQKPIWVAETAACWG